jgi:eukaryotic-like serine/threonine-protein kinase
MRTGGSTTLPEDLLRDQAVRMQMLNALGVILWSLNFLMDKSIAPHGYRGPYRFLIELSAAAFSAGVLCFMRYARASERFKVDVGVVCTIPHAFALAMLNSWVAQPTTMRPLSGVVVLILLFGMLAPARPGKMLAASLVAAAMDPLGVWIAHLRGLPVPSPLATLGMFYPNFVCAILAVAPARVLYRLGRQLREARALGSYQLVELLGEGGMGEVWKGRHRLLARSAAIKLIRPEILGDITSEDAVLTLQRFEREAQATASLTSAHTIRLYDFGVADEGTFYYVMELLDGRDLESLVREFGPLPPSRVMHLLRQTCRSLGEAHARGLIHRDVKPANIYVCRMGLDYDFVKVLDFGLVKQEVTAHSSNSLLTTAAPVRVGTPAYMAPEAILGDPNIDRRADIYALGCVAYFLLTGERVFEAETPVKLLMRHVEAAPVPPSQRTEQPISRQVDELVLACLQKDPARRPSDAIDLFHRLDALDIEPWDHRSARHWWEAHLPQFAKPLSDHLRGWDAQPRVLAAQ